MCVCVCVCVVVCVCVSISVGDILMIFMKIFILNSRNLELQSY